MKNPSNYLTIKQAVELTGKHPDTIRAFLRKNKEKLSKDSKGRVLIPYELISQAYEIREEAVVETEEQAEPVENVQRIEVQTLQSQQEALIDLLRAELEKKNEQIERQQKTIDDMQGTLTNLVSQQQQLSAHLMLNSGQQANEKPQNSPDEGKKKHWWSRSK